ncbi:HAD family hydrolase [Thalassotalea maritima]|uniref:sulfotransferase-like domain-containing protein n=1 Tax=Thalassotalea maritima TaxID=3242416 RepID=UPI003528B5E7
MTLNIAMWSGPRNISTAMMRSFENRDDTCVIDEPFYGYYLKQTGADHPLAEQVIASQPTRWQDVSAQLISNKTQPICYQKLMTHHMLDDIDLQWCKQLRHCFLIRDPKQVIHSYLQKMPSVCDDDIGIIKQWRLYQQLADITKQRMPIIDSNDILKAPKTMLQKLCEQLDIHFDEKMLNWPKGKRDSDGVWASHWYKNVENSTGFSRYSYSDTSLPNELGAMLERNNDYYQQMYEKRIKI